MTISKEDKPVETIRSLFNNLERPQGPCSKAENEIHDFMTLAYLPAVAVQVLCKFCLMPITFAIDQNTVPVADPDDDTLPN